MTSSCTDHRKIGAPIHRARRRTHQRGTTFIEAICVMSVLVILWAGSMHFGKLTLLRFQTQAKARACAWQMAMNYCDAEKAKIDCGPPQTTKDDQADEKFEALDEAYDEEDEEPVNFTDDEWTGQTETQGTQQAEEETRDHLKTAVDGLILTRVTTSDSKEIKRPPLLGGETIQVGGQLSLPCNVEPWSKDSLLHPDSIFESLTDKKDP